MSSSLFRKSCEEGRGERTLSGRQDTVGLTGLAVKFIAGTNTRAANNSRMNFRITLHKDRVRASPAPPSPLPAYPDFRSCFGRRRGSRASVRCRKYLRSPWRPRMATCVSLPYSFMTASWMHPSSASTGTEETRVCVYHSYCDCVCPTT